MIFLKTLLFDNDENKLSNIILLSYEENLNLEFLFKTTFYGLQNKSFIIFSNFSEKNITKIDRGNPLSPYYRIIVVISKKPTTILNKNEFINSLSDNNLIEKIGVFLERNIRQRKILDSYHHIYFIKSNFFKIGFDNLKGLISIEYVNNKKDIKMLCYNSENLFEINLNLAQSNIYLNRENMKKLEMLRDISLLDEEYNFQNIKDIISVTEEPINILYILENLDNGNILKSFIKQKGDNIFKDYGNKRICMRIFDKYYGIPLKALKLLYNILEEEDEKLTYLYYLLKKEDVNIIDICIINENEFYSMYSKNNAIYIYYSHIEERILNLPIGIFNIELKENEHIKTFSYYPDENIFLIATSHNIYIYDKNINKFNINPLINATLIFNLDFLQIQTNGEIEDFKLIEIDDKNDSTNKKDKCIVIIQERAISINFFERFTI